MELYHATIKEYENGQTYSIDDYEGDNYFYTKLNDEQKKVEELLEESRNQDTPQRRKCFFFFDNLDYCSYFFSRQYPGEPFHVYKVNVEDVRGGFPMCMVNAIKNNIELAPMMVDEYWEPKSKWNVLEYLSNKMIIIEECEVNNNHISASYQYNLDSEKAGNFNA
ncbi:MAG: hypothetical protein IIX52_06595 [Paludibacteraceae bacterium]|nr:hypothetical protein [Paludibacteraceae bacterium]